MPGTPSAGPWARGAPCPSASSDISRVLGHALSSFASYARPSCSSYVVTSRMNMSDKWPL
eukprot:6966319-Pyramimonas_sp.AAC.1